MIEIYDDIVSPDLSEKLKNLEFNIQEFRTGKLDTVSVEKLREYFRTDHIYNSTGIEGNRLTLQETALVLREGIDISGKPLKDSIEVKNLGLAFDLLYDMAGSDVPVNENYLKQLQKLIVGDAAAMRPGEYRHIGVIITGSEHKPPEPFEVPIRMPELIDWINRNIENNPIIVGAIAHHQFVKIHPFVDGNGRTARLLLNLILLKRGFPICNIRRDERPAYYEALSLADNGQFEPIIEIVAENCTRLFSEYVRVREETNRLKNWAQQLGEKDKALRLNKLKTEFELWQNKLNQVKLEFKQAVAVLNESITSYYISFYEYPLITFDKYLQLKESGVAQGTNFFSIRLHSADTDKIITTFMFRFFRSASKYPGLLHVVPLELNYYNTETKDFSFIGFFPKSTSISLRSFYLNDRGVIITRLIQPDSDNPNFEKDTIFESLTEPVQTFFNQVFEHVLNIS